MKHGITVAASVAALVTMLVVPTSAQVRGDILTLVGPGSSIGANVSELSSEDTVTLKVESGVRVESVRENTPAARAGLRAGDIVVEFDGERVRGVTQFVRLVRETPPGRATRTTIVRDGARQTLTVTPETSRAIVGPDSVQPRARVRPNVDVAPFFQWTPRDFQWDVPGAAPSGQLGVSVMLLDDQLAAYFGVKQGVLVTSVAAGTPAAAAGLRAGDVLTAVGGQTVQEPSQVVSALRAAAPGSSLELRIVRDKKDVTLKAAIPERERPRSSQGRVTL